MGTVKQDVLSVLINHWPRVPIQAVHRASRKHPFSATQRLRELRGRGVLSYVYDYASRSYILLTPKSILKERMQTMIRRKKDGK